MRIVLLPVGEVNRKALNAVRDGLTIVFPCAACELSEKVLGVPRNAYNASRRQYSSTRILLEILHYAEKKETPADQTARFLGVTEVDLYVRGLNFVFGEAQCPGKAAVISLHRLRPEFYGAPRNEKLYFERALKEAVHELGHTFGLRHCPDPACVMHFSLHIGMTDRKQSDFCRICRIKLERAV